MSSKPSIESNEFLKQQGIILFNDLSLALKKLNVQCRAFDDHADYHFLKLSSQQIGDLFTSILSTIQNIHASYEKTIDPTLHNLNQLWTFLVDKKLKYPIDLFSHIANGDIIEVYDSNNKQVFRSYDFFKYCMYSLDELYSTPWNELYHRDEKHIAEYMRLLYVLNSTHSNDVHIVKTVPPHWVSQLKGSRQASHLLESKIICLVYDSNDDVKGYIHTQRVLNTRTP